MPSPDLAKLIEQMPVPNEKVADKGDRKGILSNADKQAMDQAVADLRAAGRASVVALVGVFVDTDPAADSRARHLLHALVINAGGWPADERRALADALASTLGGDRPKEVQGFVIRQIQFCGDAAVAPALGKLLADEALSSPATVALLAIRDGAADPLRAALATTIGRQRLNVVQALGVLRDAASADAIQKLITDEDRDTRLAAAWALANIGHAPSADALLKATQSEGYERTGMTRSCLLLADNLRASGSKAEATKIYTRLRDTRTDRSEQYIREIAERALAAG